MIIYDRYTYNESENKGKLIFHHENSEKFSGKRTYTILFDVNRPDEKILFEFPFEIEKSESLGFSDYDMEDVYDLCGSLYAVILDFKIKSLN